MNFYLIKYIDNNITIGRYTGGKFQIIKKNGENAQEYHKDHFWAWFKDKVCYKDEKLSFAVMTNEDSFLFPEDINIAEVHELEENQKTQEEIIEFSINLNLIYTPIISNPIDNLNRSLQTTEDKPTDIDTELKQSGISEFFRKKTRELKDDKK